jgi:hypothetical protein
MMNAARALTGSTDLGQSQAPMWVISMPVNPAGGRIHR